MNPARRSYHVDLIRWNRRITDARQVGSDHGEPFREQRDERPPHPRRFRVTMQQNHRWPVTRGQVMQFYIVDLRRA